MKVFVFMMVFLAATGLIVSGAFAAKHLPEERGKTLFNDPKAFGGEMACGLCHPDGKGVEKAAAKKEFRIAGGIQKSLEEAINACIINAARGKAIDINSREMKDMVAYFRSLGKTKGKTPGY
jgi:cytochrome c